ncbi:biosynthetic-type acetolactate synthase large subunit [Chakrabartyella piscis]|uniref:biosynthetic-type acetolactate synthase large subunit n=1 Tax=Chakrabartyella piscis TaxID=2918914 RepID=UPI0029583E1A|nr:biosynthetic-type acetolactate synthase large subunit [Chakrabartyella piscis]
MNGAEALIASLKEEQVTQMFGYAGATICSLVDSLSQTEGIAYTLVRTEQNAGHMASGYSRISGKTGVCMVTSGPGATNLITGIATAYMDSIPMVAITGQVPSHLLGRDIFQEVDITGAVAPFIKHSYLVKDPNEIPRIVKEAFHLASTGRPGPVLIDVPTDVQVQELNGPFVYPEAVGLRGYKPSNKGNDLQIKRIADAIQEAKRPVLFAGGGVRLADAQQDLMDFATTANLPVVTSMMAQALLPTGHPLNIGMLGAHGNPCANHAVASADLLIMIGCRAADRAIPNPDEMHKRMTIVHIDIDPAEIGKNMRVALPVVGHAKTVLQQLSALAPAATHADAFRKELQEIRTKELTRDFVKREGYVSPPLAMRLLGSKLDTDAITCVDVGQNQLWAGKHLPHKQGRFLTSGGLGTMGYALPCAVGAKIAAPNRQVVAICGDGSFQMSMNELSALVAGNLDVKIFMLQNHVLGLVNQIQNSAYSGAFGVALDGSPDFQTIAKAYGISSAIVTDDAGLDAAFDTMLSSKGSYLLIANVHPDATTND